MDVVTWGILVVGCVWLGFIVGIFYPHTEFARLIAALETIDKLTERVRDKDDELEQLMLEAVSTEQYAEKLKNGEIMFYGGDRHLETLKIPEPWHDYMELRTMDGYDLRMRPPKEVTSPIPTKIINYELREFRRQIGRRTEILPMYVCQR